MKATQQLRDEHEGIKIILSVLEKIVKNIKDSKPVNVTHLKQIFDFLKTFADKCHHGKEEEILFPALGKRGIPNEGGPVGVMLYEHEQGRGFIRLMVEGLTACENEEEGAAQKIISASENYIQLLRNHIEKENNILFMMADQVLTESEQSQIFDEFEKLEVKKIGLGKHEEYHHLLKELREIYL
ncbi:MAG: hemerythrin domain-containing protein [Bacteroidales bacterium]|nr:hemerythrin domain-containing protein [Bacteroidales bacterium]